MAAKRPGRRPGFRSTRSYTDRAGPCTSFERSARASSHPSLCFRLKRTRSAPPAHTDPAAPPAHRLFSLDPARSRPSSLDHSRICPVHQSPIFHPPQPVPSLCLVLDLPHTKGVGGQAAHTAVREGGTGLHAKRLVRDPIQDESATRQPIGRHSELQGHQLALRLGLGAKVKAKQRMTLERLGQAPERLGARAVLAALDP